MLIQYIKSNLDHQAKMPPSLAKITGQYILEIPAAFSSKHVQNLKQILQVAVGMHSLNQQWIAIPTVFYCVGGNIS